MSDFTNPMSSLNGKCDAKYHALEIKYESLKLTYDMLSSIYYKNLDKDTGRLDIDSYGTLSSLLNEELDARYRQLETRYRQLETKYHTLQLGYDQLKNQYYNKVNSETGYGNYGVEGWSTECVANQYVCTAL